MTENTGTATEHRTAAQEQMAPEVPPKVEAVVYRARVAAPQKSPRKRGAGFPIVALPEAVAILRKAGRHGNEHSNSAFATYLGHSTPNSGSFKRRLAAFRDWKFILRMTGDRVVFTDLGRRVAYPTDSAKERNDLQEAFQNATLFWKVYDDSAKGVGISLATLANHGVQLGVAPMSKEQFAESLAQSAVEAGLAELEGNKVVFLGGNDVAVELRDSAQVTDQMVVAHPIYGGGPIGTVRVDAADPEEPVSAVDPGVVASARPAASVQGVGRDVIEHQGEPEERPAVLHQQTWDFKVGNLVFEIKSSRSLPASAFMQIGKVMSEIEKLKDLLTEGPESGESAE
jgi:hypothetical protein